MPTKSDTLSEYERKRDFTKTEEPRPQRKRRKAGSLEFVVQKHAASHLHYDLRLEMDGAMKSWAVPKGPSLDPSVRRLAMEVEDHPMAYNTFEGTIPKGEYGGGTVMLWDRGEYEPEGLPEGKDASRALLAAHRAGKITFTMHGERLRGSFALIRTRGRGGKAQWLLIKQDDEHARAGSDVTSEYDASVATGRSMEAIAGGVAGSRNWRSNRAGKSKKSKSASPPPLEPMLARTGEPGRGEWIYEPKYDGIRVLAFATPGQVALITRNGKDKAKQFPELVSALRELSAELGEPIVLDGEVVALAGGEIVRFGELQGRMHLTKRGQIARLSEEQPAALVAFDILLIGDHSLVHSTWRERREELEHVLEGRATGTVRMSEVSTDRKALREQARRQGWEGLIAKRPDARYRPGRRSGDWLKIKYENQQEFVVGGWTEPRSSRKHLGAILLGYYDENAKLVYAGHTGGGFSARALQDMYRRLKRLERKTPPFTEKPSTNERAHWTTPKVVVQVKFNEWTRDGKLRQPTFLGVRDDKDPKTVVREPDAARSDAGEEAAAGAGSVRSHAPPSGSLEDLRGPIVNRLRRMREKSPSGGTLKLGRGAELQVSNLEKKFFPDTGHTKGDLLEFYAGMAKHILPWMKDRPLVLKRYPNGIDGESFYQQAAPDEVPDGVRVEGVSLDGGDEQPRLVGGELATLLYTVQLGAISYDPWHSRVGKLDAADYTVLDLDPGPSASFQDVVRVARWVKEEMDELGLHGALKTSGSSGVHIYLPLPAGTPLDAASLVAQIVATRVARRDPELATVKRMRKDRPKGAIYLDYLQNSLGKTVAGVYAVRAKPGATVSTPLDWDELTGDLQLTDFTVETVPARVRDVGDLWTPSMKKPNDLSRLLALAG